MDTPMSLDDALEKASNGNAEELEEVESVETESDDVQPAEVKQPEDKKEVSNDQTEGESFTKLDPNALPEEVKPFYKNLVADYTRKRQAETAEVKAVRAQNEELMSRIQQLEQGFNDTDQTEVSEPQGVLTEEDVERIFVQRQEAVWEKQAVLDLPNIDPRLDEHNPIEFDEDLDNKVRTVLDEALTAYEKENGTKLGFNYRQTASEAIQAYDKKLESLFKSYLKRQSNLIKEKSDTLRKSAPAVSTAKSIKNTGKVSLDQALRDASEGL